MQRAHARNTARNRDEMDRTQRLQNHEAIYNNNGQSKTQIYDGLVQQKRPKNHLLVLFLVLAQLIENDTGLRKDRDSNPGYSYLYNGFRDRPVRPLRHLSIALLQLRVQS